MKSLGLSIFPNPSEGTFTIDFGKTIDHAYISVKDVSGKEIYNNSFNDEKIAIVELMHQAKGTYIIRIDVDGQSIFAKMIIEK